MKPSSLGQCFASQRAVRATVRHISRTVFDDTFCVAISLPFVWQSELKKGGSQRIRSILPFKDSNNKISQYFVAEFRIWLYNTGLVTYVVIERGARNYTQRNPRIQRICGHIREGKLWAACRHSSNTI